MWVGSGLSGGTGKCRDPSKIFDPAPMAYYGAWTCVFVFSAPNFRSHYTEATARMKWKISHGIWYTLV